MVVLMCGNLMMKYWYNLHLRKLKQYPSRNCQVQQTDNFCMDNNFTDPSLAIASKSVDIAYIIGWILNFKAYKTLQTIKFYFDVSRCWTRLFYILYINKIFKKSTRRPKIDPAADENQVIFFIGPNPGLPDSGILVGTRSSQWTDGLKVWQWTTWRTIECFYFFF
jgi:hypothetical protein